MMAEQVLRYGGWSTSENRNYKMKNIKNHRKQMCRCLFQSEKSYTRMYTNCNWPLFEEKPYCTQTPTDHCLKKSHMRMYTNSSWPLITSEVCKLTSKNDQRRRKNYKSRSAEIFISLPYVHLSMMKLVMLNILWGSSHYSFSLRVSPLSPPPP